MWEGMQEAWAAFRPCCGHTVCPGAGGGGGGCCRRALLICRKATEVPGLERKWALVLALRLARVRRCPAGLVGLCIQPYQLPSLQWGANLGLRAPSSPEPGSAAKENRVPLEGGFSDVPSSCSSLLGLE